MFSGLEDEAAPVGVNTTLLITSAEPSEGKSSTVANLGITMAQSGKKTLIIDCDFRKPSLDRIFGIIDTSFGLVDLLMDREMDNGVGLVVQHTDVENLDIIPCGNIPANPSELLSLSKTATMFKKLEAEYDVILIDSPPVNVVTDSVILSQIVDGVVLIFHAGKTRKNIAQRAKEQLEEAGARILGGVINNVNIKKARYNYYYYYAYHYPRYYREDSNGQRERRKEEVG
jgi:capsular exopolysaccharide synthesis family protein